DRLPGAAVPDQDAAAAVLALRDHALEVGVLERVVLGLRCEPPLAGHEARSLRHRPALEHAVELEPEVVVQAARGVLLHDEAPAARPTRARVARASRVAARLGAPAEVAPAPVVLEARRASRQGSALRSRR